MDAFRCGSLVVGTPACRAEVSGSNPARVVREDSSALLITGIAVQLCVGTYCEPHVSVQTQPGTG
jgi:hypothetical protein